MKIFTFLLVLFTFPQTTWAFGSYFSGSPSLADLVCRSHPIDSELKFCVRNSDSDVPPSLNYEEYLYKDGELTMVNQVSYEMSRALGVLFSTNGDLLVHVYGALNHVYGQFYHSADFFSGTGQPIYALSIYDIKGLRTLDDHGVLVYEITCNNGESPPCLKALNIFTGDISRVEDEASKGNWRLKK